MLAASEFVAYRLTICQRNDFEEYTHYTQYKPTPAKPGQYRLVAGACGVCTFFKVVSLADSKSTGYDLECFWVLVIEL